MVKVLPHDTDGSVTVGSEGIVGVGCRGVGVLVMAGEPGVVIGGWSVVSGMIVGGLRTVDLGPFGASHARGYQDNDKKNQQLEHSQGDTSAART